MPLPSCQLCSSVASSSKPCQFKVQQPSAYALRIQRRGCNGCNASQQSSSIWHQSKRHAGGTVVRANDKDEEGDLLIEEELRSRRRKKKNKVNVVAPQVQQAYGLEPQTAEGQLETSYLLVLGLVFVIIILEGLFIAISGFLPEAADQFAQDVVYPSFSPTVGFFLLLSSLYGIWKSGQQ